MASFLHAKVAIIDDQAMVGSSNLDPNSLLLAREANVFVDEPGFAHDLKTSLESALRTHARQVTLQSLKMRSLAGRMVDSVSYVLLRLGVKIGREHVGTPVTNA